MATKKRAPPEAEKGPALPAPGKDTESICVAMDARQLERLADLMKREPLWGRTQCVRHLMGVVEYLEQQLATVPAFEAYAIQHHLTLPAPRRPARDFEWMVDVLMILARERLTQLESRGKLPSGQ